MVFYVPNPLPPTTPAAQAPHQPPPQEIRLHPHRFRHDVRPRPNRHLLYPAHLHRLF